MTVYSVTLPNGRTRLCAPSFRLLFFVCCGFVWNPSKPAAAGLTIQSTTFEKFLAEWAGKIEQGKRGPHA